MARDSSIIDRDTALHVAKLARLGLEEDEIEAITRELDAILSYIRQLNDLETDGVEPTSHVVPMDTPFREDRVGPSLSVDEALQNAPDPAGRHYRVPKIIE